MKVAKLVLGILMVIISALVLLASCVGLAVTLSVDSFIGLIVGALMLSASIIDIATSKSENGTKNSATLFLTAGIVGVLLAKIGSAFEVFSLISMAAGFANLVILIKQPKSMEVAGEEQKEQNGMENASIQGEKHAKKRGKSNKITGVVILAVIAVVAIAVMLLANSMNDTSDTSHVSSSKTTASTTTLKDVELVDTGFCQCLNYIETFSLTSEDTMYVRYVGIVHNPNENQCADFPKVIATIKNKDGVVIATGEVTIAEVLPGESVPVVGEISLDRSNIDDGTTIQYQVSCSRYSKYTPTTSDVHTADFQTSNIAQITSNGLNVLTGEVTNNSGHDYGFLQLVLIMRNQGKIVYVATDTLNNLESNQTRAFAFKRYQDWPEHDSVEVVVTSFI